MLVVAEVAEEGGGDDAGDVEEGEKEGRGVLGEESDVVGVCV